MIFYIYLVLAITLTSFGQVFYKLYFQKKKKRYIVLSLALFISTPYFGYLALSGLPIDIVSISSALILVFVQVLSRTLLKETQTTRQLFATVLIVMGLFIYSL